MVKKVSLSGFLRSLNRFLGSFDKTDSITSSVTEPSTLVWCIQRFGSNGAAQTSLGSRAWKMAANATMSDEPTSSTTHFMRHDL